MKTVGVRPLPGSQSAARHPCVAGAASPNSPSKPTVLFFFQLSTPIFIQLELLDVLEARFNHDLCWLL